MSPPFHWAQSLNTLEFEIKYAYRHDVAGCADLFNETVRITKDVFWVGTSCKELDQTMYFELKFKLWDEIDVDSLKIEKIPVGKHYISVNKTTQQARWSQLYLDDTPKPPMMKIWYEKFMYFHNEMEDFEGDDIDEYAGWDLFDDDL